MRTRTLALLPLLVVPLTAQADPAVVEGAIARAVGAEWTVDVTLSHGDTGWDDYADGWRIEDASGAVLGTRELLHPHVTEQPFTRSLVGCDRFPMARPRSISAPGPMWKAGARRCCP